jgi:signal transduction histidine kinase
MKGTAGSTRAASPFLRYGLAIICLAAAFCLRLSLTPLIGGQSPFMVFAPAALVAARFGGLGPGLLALAGGLVLGDYFFTLPLHSWGPYGPAEITLILTYTITTLVGVILFHVLQRSRREVQEAAQRAERAAAEAKRRGEELEREVAERRRAEAALQEAKEQITAYANQLETRVAERTDKLRQSLNSLEAVLYHVAHDLRAPLRAMQGFTNILLKEYVENLDDRGKDYARRISEASRRMDELLRDLLDYGRFCGVELITTKIELDKTVDALLLDFQPEIERRSAVVEVARPLGVVTADAKMVREILKQLLSNALKFVPEGRTPRIQIKSEQRGDRLRLWVEDNGMGIEPEHHERIFRVFERLGQKFPGTGIGLAIVQRAAERMGGGAGVESELGAGSRFWVELPTA